MRDVIVIGKGPAGISAAIYLKRAGIDVLVLGKDLGALEKSEKIENFYGLDEPLSGKEIVEKGIAQAESFGIEVVADEVTSITKEEDFIVSAVSKTYEAKAVLIATGKSRTSVDIKGFEEYKGKGISFCAVCDGFFYKNKKIAVIGNGDYAMNELNELRNFTKDIILFTDDKKLTTEFLPQGVPICTDKITEFYGDDKIKGITAGKTNYDVDGVFVAVGTASASDFAMKMGVFTENQNIIVDENYMTNIEGLYSAGDAIGGFLQIAKAVSDGAHASRSIIKYIKNKNKEKILWQ